MSEGELTQEEFDAAMNHAAKCGMLIFILGMLTFGIGPCLYWMYREAKEA